MSTTQMPRADVPTHEFGAVRPDARTPYRPGGRSDAPPARTLTVGKVSGVLLLAAVLGGLTGGAYALVTATPPPVGSVVGGKTPGPPPATSAPPQTTEIVVTAKPSGHVRTVQASPRAAVAPSPSAQASGSAVYYASCSDAPGPIPSGQPGYRPALDRDSDGIACESTAGRAGQLSGASTLPPSGSPAGGAPTASPKASSPPPTAKGSVMCPDGSTAPSLGACPPAAVPTTKGQPPAAPATPTT